MSGPPTVSNSFKSRQIEVTEKLLVRNTLSAANTFTKQLSVGNVQVRTVNASNVFIGNDTTGNMAAAGNHNFLFGNNAGRDNTGGSSNNFLGDNAGRDNTAGNFNNFLGNNAGSNNAIGSNNTIIGNDANVATNNLTGVIVLGTGAIATQDNQIVFSTADVSFRNIGNTFQVGSNVLPNNLTVFGNISATQTIFIFDGDSDQWNSTFTTVQNNSASWDESAEIEAITTVVATNSGNWNSAYNTATVYQSNSATYATNSTVNSVSSLLTPLTLTNILTSQLVLNNDVRLSNTRDPNAHTHLSVDITDLQYEGLAFGLYDGANDAAGATVSDGELNIIGTHTATFNTQNITADRTITVPDANITLDDQDDPRDPNSHAASHAAAGSDPVFDQDLTTQDEPVFRSLQLTNLPDAADGAAFYNPLIVDDEGTLSFIGTKGPEVRASLGLGDAATTDIGTAAGEVCAGDDARLSDTRDPNAHAASHAAGGSDPLEDSGLVTIESVNTNRTFSDSDSNKIFHFDTTTQSLCAIFPTVLPNGFNVAIMNTGTNTLRLSAAQLNSVGVIINIQYGGAFVYKDNNELFAVGRL